MFFHAETLPLGGKKKYLFKTQRNIKSFLKA